MQIIVAAEMPEITDAQAGRYAELKRLIDDERNKVSPTFFIFGGGSIGPSAFANFDRGSHIIDILNYLEPDAMGVAKREFSFFEDELSLRAYEALFPVVSSNITDTRIDKVPDGLNDTVLITRGNTTVGFISVLDERLISEYLLKSVAVTDPQKVVREKSKQLRAAGADLIFLHYFEDFQWIHQVLDERVIDYAFISNTRLYPEATERLKDDGRILLLNQPGDAIVATFERKGNFDLVSERSVVLSEYASDLAAEKVVDSYVSRLNRLLDDRVAYFGRFYTTRRETVRNGENAFANFVVDAMREFGNAEIALVNGGSIRGDTSYQKNTSITRRTIATELPFRSTLRMLSITGADLLAALEQGYESLDLLKGGYPHVSGIQIKMDSSAPVGSRIISASVNGKPVLLDKTYRLMTTDYLADGGDGFTALTNAEAIADSGLQGTILISDLVLRTLRLRGVLDNEIDGRVIDLAANDDADKAEYQ